LVSRSKMCVTHRHLNRLVPHQFSYRPQIDACHHKPARKRVTQTIPGEVPDSRFTHCRIEPMLVTLQWLPMYVNKNPARSVQRALLQNLERSNRN
jgi:hypothetical protein